MCLIGFAWLAHPRWRLVLAANRDEFNDRPAATAAWWPDAPQVFGGRDLQAGGTWLALDRRGRLAAVTNYREPGAAPGPRSRGELVAGFVRGNEDIDDYAAGIAARPADWSGFSLLLFDLAGARRARYLSNRTPSIASVPIAAGVHALSNSLLNFDWPKVRGLRARISDALSDATVSHAPLPAPAPALSGDASPGGGAAVEALSGTSSAPSADALERALFDALADDRVAPDLELPNTGLDLERERLLSSARIRGEGYGTRVSTVVLVDHEGRVEFVELGWSPDHERAVRQKRASFALQACC